MKKLAVFVEGQTEQQFIEKLLLEIAGANKVRFEKKKAVGKILIREGASAPHPDQKYYVQIINCSADNRVKSEIRDNYQSLVKQNFSAIIGLRDVYPELRKNIPALQRLLYAYIKTKPVRPELVLSIMEIEAWFLAEHKHFEKISSALTMNRIKAALGFDPSKDDMEMRDHPAKDLDDVYRLAGFRYTKSSANSARTIRQLDYADIYIELIKKLPPFNHFALKRKEWRKAKAMLAGVNSRS
jgi:hypothetical protein